MVKPDTKDPGAVGMEALDIRRLGLHKQRERRAASAGCDVLREMRIRVPLRVEATASSSTHDARPVAVETFAEVTTKRLPDATVRLAAVVGQPAAGGEVVEIPVYAVEAAGTWRFLGLMGSVEETIRLLRADRYWPENADVVALEEVQDPTEAMKRCSEAVRSVCKMGASLVALGDKIYALCDEPVWQVSVEKVPNGNEVTVQPSFNQKIGRNERAFSADSQEQAVAFAEHIASRLPNGRVKHWGTIDVKLPEALSFDQDLFLGRNVVSIGTDKLNKLVEELQAEAASTADPDRAWMMRRLAREFIDFGESLFANLTAEEEPSAPVKQGQAVHKTQETC